MNNIVNQRLLVKLRCVGLAILAATCAADGAAAAWEPGKDDFVVVSGPASPRVAFAANRSADEFRVVLDVAAFDAKGSGTSVAVGLAAAKKVILADKDAKVSRGDGAARYTFALPAASLVTQMADWPRLRMGIAVAWTDGPLGKDRQRERFRHAGGAPHTGLSSNEADWLPFDIAEYEAMVADRRNRITVKFAQPMDGKATIVIDDAQGNRVRNLLAGVPMAKGAHEVEWDGLDEAGNVVAPASYAWRAISHPGITPEYLFSFCNDGQPPWRTGSGRDMWGPDHTCLTQAAAGDKWTFLAGSCAESGYAIVAVDETGTKRMHYNPVGGTGLGKVCLASAGKYLYAAHDGLAWGERIDQSKPDWKAQHRLTVTRFDVESGRVAEWPGRGRFVTVSTVEFGPGSVRPKWEGMNLGGMAILDGKLYVSCTAFGSLLVLNADNCEKAGEIKLDAPGALATGKAAIFAASKSGIVKLDPATGAANPVIAEGAASPAGIAVDAAGKLYVSDTKTNTVKVFDPSGKPLSQIGKLGGGYEGAYDAGRLVNPRGLAVAPNGWLWVTEERFNPKRATAWDLRTGKLVKEKFGPTAYGASGGGFDFADHTRWIGQGAAWELDYKSKSAACRGILAKSGGHVGGYYNSAGYEYVREGGRVFVIGFGGVATISEFRRDGSLRDLAFAGSTHRFCFACNWKPPAAFVEAFNAAYPDKKGKHADKGPGVLWVDRNGDGLCQPEEFDFSTNCDNFAGAYWGHLVRDLTIRVPVTAKGRRLLVTLKPDGFNDCGAPRYPRLNNACSAGVPIDLESNELETAVDRFGNLICNSDPRMKSFSPDGKLLWTYPNRWSNVHGSHAAPLPEIGMMQGALYFLGMTPFDDKADVFMMNGNHGRFFVITSDGFYLDEIFKDVRMGATADAYLIGGECFGGFFSKSEKDGNYYLQSGHTDYRIFRIDGIGQARRSAGRVAVSPAQAIAAESSLKRKAATVTAARETSIPFAAPAPAIDGKENGWPAGYTAQWDKSGRFPVKLRCAWDDTNLYLCYVVDDGSPWVNNGKDPTLLFKTGDSVDLQLGTDTAANPARTGPVPGDLRLLIAPFQGKNIAVLYRHRVPGTKEPVSFISPWRSEKVDSVAILEQARIAVAREGNRYRVQAAIPLSDLGLKEPGGKTLKADFGVLFGDPDGAMTMLRSYWSNQATGLVNDVPGEIMLAPNLWGTATFERKNPQ